MSPVRTLSIVEALPGSELKKPTVAVPTTIQEARRTVMAKPRARKNSFFMVNLVAKTRNVPISGFYAWVLATFGNNPRFGVPTQATSHVTLNPCMLRGR